MGGNIWGDERLTILIAMVSTYIRRYQIAYFKHLQFIECQLYLNRAIF